MEMGSKLTHVPVAKPRVSRGLRSLWVAALVAVALVGSMLACGSDEDPDSACTSTRDCNAGDICVPSSCGDSAGTCEVRPDACAQDYAPVCGCDGQTYSNRCMALLAGATVASTGECKSSCSDGSPLACRRLPPQCGAGTQLAIINGCYECVDPVSCMPAAPTDTCGGFLGQTCGADEFCNYPPSATCGFADATGTCTTKPQACPRNYDPVCGCDGQTYSNSCTANAAGVSVESQGACSTAGQVCGTRGAQPCGMDDYCDWDPTANCGRTDLPGTCQQKPQACIQLYDPVCGCDGKTYSNGCMANAAGISVESQGACSGGSR